MRRLPVALCVGALLIAACGQEGGAQRLTVEMRGAGLLASQIGAVRVVALGGSATSCPKVLDSPDLLADASFTLFADGLFTRAGGPSTLSVPRGVKVIVYAAAYASEGGEGLPLGRACEETRSDAPDVALALTLAEGL
jgi:hypothetical protein